MTVRTETTVSILSEVPTWDQYRLFFGWSVTADSESVDNQPGAQITLDASILTSIGNFFNKYNNVNVCIIARM